MIINKILNNNVVITLDDNDEEVIVMGKGIGYQKSKGNLIDKTKVNKVFRISNKEISNKLQELLNNIPIEHMKLSSEIIEYAQIKLNKKRPYIFCNSKDERRNKCKKCNPLGN
ncbi:CAT RNA binding domain-containing protein [Clostridioides difficile]